MEHIKNLISLRDYCRANSWPRLPQWNHWITDRKPVAIACIKKIGGRYMIDQKAFADFVAKATLDEL